jgi:hypothetical protein
VCRTYYGRRQCYSSFPSVGSAAVDVGLDSLKGGAFDVQIINGQARSRDLPLATDLYYPLSSLDPRLLLAQSGQE